MKLLLAAATDAEIRPCVEWLRANPDSSKNTVEVLITGLGMMTATFSLTQLLSKKVFDFVIGAGIAGAFNQRLRIGECVIVVDEQLGDTGAEDHDAFLDVFDMGLLPPNTFPFRSGRLGNSLAANPFPIDTLRQVSGITIGTVSGNEGTIAKRMLRYNPDVESMEGASLHYVCLQMGIPFIQLRAISNYVTPRDRSAWKIGEAIHALNDQLKLWLAS